MAVHSSVHNVPQVRYLPQRNATQALASYCEPALRGDGNCLFRALSYIITVSVRQHCKLCSVIVQHLQTTTHFCRLMPNYIRDNSVAEYISRTHIAEDNTWGSEIEMLVLAHLLGVNIVYHFEGLPCVESWNY